MKNLNTNKPVCIMPITIILHIVKQKTELYLQGSIKV